MTSENRLYRGRIAAAGGRQSLDDLVSSNALAALRKDPHIKNVTKGVSAPQQEQALVASLVKRLNEVEAAGSELSQRVIYLQHENQELQTKLAHAHASATSPATLAAAAAATAAAQPAVHGGSSSTAEAAMVHLQEEAARLRRQCKAAWGQVADMKQFLNDHGLIWVGENADIDGGGAAATTSDASASAAVQPQQPKQQQQQERQPKQQEGLPCSLEELAHAVNELNRVAGDGIGRIAMAAAKSGAARLQTPEAVPLVLFKDGLQLADHPPRPYSDATATAVLSDILDGFFPSMLKREHPDGVPLCLVDRTREGMAAATAAAPGNMRTFEQLGRAGANDKDALLARLPKTVIKNGRIMDVRSSVGEFMSGTQQSTQAAQDNAGVQRHLLVRANSAVSTTHAGVLSSSSTAALAEPAQAVQQPLACSSQHDAQAQMSTLQIKSEDGHDTYILKLKYTDTIAAVRRCIDAHRGSVRRAQGSPSAPGYEIRSRMPANTYSDEGQTLEQAGLVPNATLFLKSLLP